jgi:hypothetical protein
MVWASPEFGKTPSRLSLQLIRRRLAPRTALVPATYLPAVPRRGHVTCEGTAAEAGQQDDYLPITVDLNGHEAVQAKGAGQKRITGLLLSHSEVTGTPVRFDSSRGYLARVTRLDFKALEITDSSNPVVCDKDVMREAANVRGGVRSRSPLWAP